MPREFKLPDLGEGIKEGEILDILVSKGDQVEEDQTILEVETDKAAVEIPSPFSGTVTEIHVETGDLVQVDEVLFTFDDVQGDGNQKAQKQETRDEAPSEEKKAQKEAEKQPYKRASEEQKTPVPASPSTRRLARELEVDLSKVQGSGPAGRVTSQDLRDFAESEGEPEEAEKPPKMVEISPEEKPDSVESVFPMRPSAIPLPELPDFSRWGEVERVPLRSIRRTTARNMTLSWSQIPHVSHQDVADISDLEEFRQDYKGQIDEQDGSLTLTVFVMKAAVTALKDYPNFNSSLDTETEEIVLKQYYHIGVAVDTERGLLVPVIRDVDKKSVADLSEELLDLVTRTQEGDIKLQEMQGGTITVTNPGPLGGTGFTPLINYPQVAILGVAQARWQPVVLGEGKLSEIAPRFILPLILSFDHRVADGAGAARFLDAIIQLLEDPDQLLLHI